MTTMTTTKTTTTIFDKTAKGREEIATRGHRVPARMRTLLLLVDGKRDVVDLMAKVAGLGLNEKSLEELHTGEFIRPIEASVGLIPAQQPLVIPTHGCAVASMHAAPPGLEPTALVHQIHINAASKDSLQPPVVVDQSESVLEQPPALVSATSGLTPHAAGTLRAGESQFQAIMNFFNETIRSSIGLGGFAMQLKVERATTIDDFRALRKPYLEAVLESKGPELERSLRNRLDQLLNLEN